MKHPWIFIFMIVFILLSLSACQKATDNYNSTLKALEFLKQYKNGDPESDVFWGMNVDRVFGPACAGGDWIGQSFHNPLKHQEGSDEFELTYHCWISGDQEGKNVKQIRDVVMYVLKDPASGEFKVDSYRFETRPLTTGRQIGNWFLWGLLGPILMIIYFILMASGTSGCVNPWALGIGIIAVLVYIGQVSYWTFGTWWAVALGVIIYAVIYGTIGLVVYSANS